MGGDDEFDRRRTNSASAFRQARMEVSRRLRARHSEIEQTVLSRVHAVDPDTAVDAGYADGVRAAVSAALAYGLLALERGEEHTPPVPAALLGQARVAARSGISLDTVVRRYFAGYTLLGDFLVGEAEEGGILSSVFLQRLLRVQAVVFDHVIAAVTAEYGRETQILNSPEQRRAVRVERLLAGELLDTSDLAYELDAWHLGVIATGPAADEAIRFLAREFDRRPLIVRRSEGAIWGWLGGRQRVDPVEIEKAASEDCPAEIRLALGEPGQDLPGWRLTHQQAKATMAVAVRGSANLVRYSEVALLASALRDDLLPRSLRELYLQPLAGSRDGGAVHRDTLRAFFAARRNVSSTAAALGVSRRTVANRMQVIEERLGPALSADSAEMEIALRLQELEQAERAGPSLGISKGRYFPHW
jgi:hypothetical protein